MAYKICKKCVVERDQTGRLVNVDLEGEGNTRRRDHLGT